MLRVPVAVLPSAGMAVMAGGTVGGCITQDLQFVPPTNFPPSIEVPAGAAHPFDEVIRLRADGVTGGDDAGPVTTIFLQVEVRDPDVDQELQYKLFVDYQRGVNEFFYSDFIPPASTGASDRRRRTLSVPLPVRDVREPGCHRVELLVSERFQAGREPLVAGDLGTATWWVATQASEGEAVDMTGCP